MLRNCAEHCARLALLTTIACSSGASPVPSDGGPPGDAPGDTYSPGDTAIGDATPPGDTAPFAVGTPISAPDDQWTWVDFPDSRCMNDTPTGIAINPSSTGNRLLIFMSGGNACFNVATCAVTWNKDGYDATKFASDPIVTWPLFDRAETQNIFRDYHYVWVPYCTGDVHAGANPAGLLNGETWNYNGFGNMTEFLRRLVPTFACLEVVVLSGFSAGGFGSFFNFYQTSRAFDPILVVVIDDSGPPMPAPFVPACLQDHFRTLWGLDQILPPGCTACRNAPDGRFIRAYTDFVLDAYPSHRFAVISSRQDATIRQFWGFGNDDCANLLPGTAPQPYSGNLYQAGLENIRDQVALGSNLKVWLADGSRHIWLDDPAWNTAPNGVNLSAWISDAIEGTPGWDHAP